MDRKYGGVIWTNHALLRLQQRKVKQGDAWAAWKRPDNSKYDPNKGAWVYRRAYKDEEIEIVAKKNDRGEWIILSVWSNRIKSGQKKEKENGNFLTLLVKKLFKIA